MEKKRVRFAGKKLPDGIEKNGLYDLLITEEDGKKLVRVWKAGCGGQLLTKMEYKPEEWNMVAEAKLQLSISDEDIDDIMVEALEGGINYWCDEAKVDGKSQAEYASEQISRGGRLILHDSEKDRDYILRKENFVDGIVKYLQNPHPYNITGEPDGVFIRIDAGKCDAVVCDMIIQYAIFGEVIYG